MRASNPAYQHTEYTPFGVFTLQPPALRTTTASSTSGFATKPTGDIAQPKASVIPGTTGNSM